MIEHLRGATKPGEAVVYCFFDYARHKDLTADAVLAELPVQIASSHRNRVFSIVRSLYERAEDGRRKPTLRELTVAFKDASSCFEGLFVVADALDECDHPIRRQLLLALNPTGNSNIHIMIFSRPHVQPNTYFSKASARISEIEIQAHAADLEAFIGTRIADNEDLGCVIENCEITTEQIVHQTVQKAGFR